MECWGRALTSCANLKMKVSACGATGRTHGCNLLPLGHRLPLLLKVAGVMSIPGVVVAVINNYAVAITTFPT